MPCKTQFTLRVLGTQPFGSRPLCPLCSEAEVTRVAGRTKEGCPNSPDRIHREPTSPVSTLTARFDPRWNVVVDVRVAACVLRIGGINIATTTANNVGTSSSFKEILAPE